MKNKTENSSGITLAALVVTLIVLLILAAVGLNSVFNDKGIFNRAVNAGEKHNEAKAREVLETVLLADGQYEKNINPDYNQDDFLDELIKNEIPGTEIKGDVAIVGEWAFELDRSVPKIGRTLGKADKLIFPTVEIISGPTLIDNEKKATFKAKATETTKGITRIELWLDGKRIEKETKTYETPQTETVLDFEVNKNGKYTVKAYADLMASATAEVTGIVPSVEFTPNGNTEWKKTHTTKVEVKETGETITAMKYLWVKDDNVNEPAISAFTQNCSSDGVVTGGDDTMTGTYYLWVLLIIGTESNQKTNICVSNGFNFDNEAPTVTLVSTPVSETSFTLTVTASDNHSGVAKYEFYIDGIKADSKLSAEKTVTYSWSGNEMADNKDCSVAVFDTAGNKNSISKKSRTKLFHWKVYYPIVKPSYGKVYVSSGSFTDYYKSCMWESFDTEPECDENGNWIGKTEEVYMGQLRDRWTWINGITDGYIIHISNISKLADNGDMTIYWDKIKRPERVPGEWDRGTDIYTVKLDAFTAGMGEDYVKYEYLGIE